MEAFFQIITRIILPIFVLMGAGILLERRYKLDVNTISKLSFYVFIPALLFRALVDSQLDFDKLAVVAAFQVALVLVMFVLSAGAAKALRLERGVTSAFLLAAVFCNSANYGIPLVQLAFSENPSLAVSYQAITIMVQNLSTFSLGLAIAHHGKASISEAAKQTFKFPFLYVVAAALLLKYMDWDAVIKGWPWLWQPVGYAADGLVAVALLTLGIQIAKTPKVKLGRALVGANVLRLAGGPAAAFGLVYLFAWLGMFSTDDMLARLVVIAAAGPSAVNTVLISLEVNGEADFAAASVFYSTILSGVTVAITIFLVQTAM